MGFPQADVVGVEHRGDEWMLVWPSPRTAAWIGKSLLVNTASGEVVVFMNVIDSVTRSGS